MRISKSAARSGLTLLEVIVSMAIFLMSLVAISQLVLMGSQRALDVKYQSQASLLCQSKLAELSVGAADFNSQGYQSFNEDPDWQWRVDASQADIAGLILVKVWVRRDRADGQVVETYLSQMVIDPNIRGSTLDPVTPTSSGTDNATQDATTSGTSGTTGSSSTTGGNP